MLRVPIFSSVIALMTVVGLGCTIEDVSDDIKVVETVPEPDAAGTAHRLTHRLAIGDGAEDISSGHFTGVEIAVIDPVGVDLSLFLRINIQVVTPSDTALLAQATDFEPGETSRTLTVEYTSDIKSFLDSSNLELQWEVYYRSGTDYPSGGVDLETVISFDVDVELL